MTRNYAIVLSLIYFLQVVMFRFREKIIDCGIVVLLYVIVILITMIGHTKLIKFWQSLCEISNI